MEQSLQACSDSLLPHIAHLKAVLSLAATGAIHTAFHEPHPQPSIHPSVLCLVFSCGR